MTALKILPYRGSIKALAQMIYREWKADHEGFIYLPEAQLKWLLKSPQVDRKWTLGCYRGKDLVGFVVVLKKKIRYRDGTFGLMKLCSLLTVKRTARKHMVHLTMLEYAAGRKQKHRREFTLNYLDARIKNDSILQVYLPHRYPYARVIREFHSWVCVPGRETAEDPGGADSYSELDITDHIKPQDLMACIRLLNKKKNLDFQEIWSKKNFAHQLYRSCRFTYALRRAGRVIGFLNGLKAPVFLRGRSVLSGLVSHAELDSLQPSQRRGLVKAMLRGLSSQGVKQVIVPDTGSTDPRLWKDCGFHHAFSSVKVYAVSERRGIGLKPGSRFNVEML